MIIQIDSIRENELNHIFDNINQVFTDTGLNIINIDTMRLNDGSRTALVTCEIIEGESQNLVASVVKEQIKLWVDHFTKKT
jgi:hypothetical protein